MEGSARINVLDQFQIVCREEGALGDVHQELEVFCVVFIDLRAVTEDTRARHYSTVNATEMRTSIAKVVSLAGFREAMAAGGMHGGMHGDQKQKAGGDASPTGRSD